MAKRGFSAEPHAPKYRQILEALSRDILSGRYQPGQKFPSEAALVLQFRTSRITVGRALRELVQRGLVDRVAGSGTFVRAVQAENGLLFGLLIPDLGETEIFEPICRGIAAAPASAHHALLWGHDAGDMPREERALQLCDQYIARKVSGVFFAPIERGPGVPGTNLEILGRLERARIPTVLLDRCVLPYPGRVHHDLVGIDNRRAGFMATEHLLSLGAARVTMVAHSGGAPTIEARIAGFREALLARGRSLQDNPVCRVDRMEEVPRGEAFVCANDRTAGELMRALLAAGRRIPQDVRIVGIDDVEYASLLPVPLTTVHQPCREIGEAAMHAMLERVERPAGLARDILLECRLVIRESCGG